MAQRLEFLQRRRIKDLFQLLELLPGAFYVVIFFLQKIGLPIMFKGVVPFTAVVIHFAQRKVYAGTFLGWHSLLQDFLRLVDKGPIGGSELLHPRQQVISSAEGFMLANRLFEMPNCLFAPT